MKMRAFLTLLLLLSASAAHAAYYSHTPATYGWIDPVAGGHTQAVFTNGAACSGGFSAPQDDDITNPVPIGFTFNYGGTGYAQLNIQTNGRLQFTSTFCGYGTETTGSPPTYPFDFPTGTPSSIGVPDMSNMIRVYGGDFDLDPSTGGGGAVYYATLGSAPNRSFVVTWYNVKEWNNPTTLFNAQIILYENGDFTFQYRDTLNFTNGHAQIGWEVSATDYDVLSYSTLGSLAFTAIRYYATPTLTAQWHFDELAWAAGGGDVADTAGGHNGSAENGASTIAVSNAIPGNPGTCRYGQFDGATQYIGFPAGTLTDLGAGATPTSFTLTAWVRTTDKTKTPQKIFGEDAAAGYSLVLSPTTAEAGRLRLLAGGSTPGSVETGAVVQNNTWYFVAAVVDLSGGQLSLYVYNAAGTLLTSISASGAWGSGGGAIAIAGDNTAADGFKGNVDEVSVYSGALMPSTLAALAIQTHLCPIQGASLGGFNAFDSSTAAGSVVGYIKTKIAGEPFSQSTGNIDIVALSGGAIDTTFSGTVSVQLVDASSGGTLDPLTGCGPWPVVATLSSQIFGAGDNGRISMNPVPQINNAVYPNLRVMVSDGAGRVGCSSDGFALRPASLLLADATQGDWLTAGTAATLNNVSGSGGQVHRAWRYFTLQATGRDALGNTLSAASGGYSGSPAGYAGAVVLPSNGTVGALETGAWSGTGTITSNTARYGEVGAFALYLEDQSFAQVDAADSQPGERYIPSNLDLIGRFVPDYFYVNADTSVTVPAQFQTFGTTSCASRSFTYIGQPFTYLVTTTPVVRNPPQALVTARNAANNTTVNYQGALWKIVATTDSTSDVTTTYTANGPGIVVQPPALPATPLAPVVQSLNNGTGTVIASKTDVFTYTRSTTTPLSPFNAAINLTVTVKDDSESAGVITTASSPTPTFSNIAFDAGNAFRYGRLRLMNSSGSQVVSLPVPAEAQYWNGTAFITNTGDNCTAIPLSTIAMGNYQKNLSSGETVIQTPTAGVPLTLSGGSGFIRLSPPGTGNEGSLDLSVNLTAGTAGASCTAGMPASTGAGTVTGTTAGTWLQGAWCGTSYTNDPTARVTFGIYTNTNLFIYQRENY